jgi:hypothetical protein
MHIEYQISESDYVNAVTLFQRTRRGAWVQRYVLPVIYGILLLPLAISAILVHNRMSVVLIPEIFLLGRGLLGPFMMRRRLVQRYRDNISIQSRNFIDIDDTGCRMRDVATDRFTAWEEFSSYVENETTFLRLRKNKTQFYITPKRELTAEQIDEFRAFCKRNLREQSVGTTRRGFVQGAICTAAVLASLWFAVPPLFWFYGVDYATKHLNVPAVVPKPLTDTSMAQLQGPTFSGYGCSIRTPFPQQVEVQTVHQVKLTRKVADDDDEDNDEKVPPEDRYSQVFGDGDFVLMALNPKLQNDALGNIRRAHGFVAQNVRDNLGSKVMESSYEYKRSVLYAQPSDARLLDLGRHNHQVFQLLILKKQELPAAANTPVFDLHIGDTRGFQFGDPARVPARIRLELFDSQDRHASFTLWDTAHRDGPLTQGQINAMVASFRCQ